MLAIKTMNELGMIVDVSHASEKSFWDIIACSKTPVIATHSNARTLCNAERNLSDQQIRVIAGQKGLIGLVAARHFVSFETAKQNADTLAKHARHIADIAGIDVLSIGFDFMDYLGGPFSSASMASDLPDASQAQNLIKALLANGFSEAETQKIAWDNAVSFFIRHLSA
jgi:membrane dipeptidase